MDNIFEILIAVAFLLFTVFAFVRRTIEGRDIEKRNKEPDWIAEDLPEQTRRMLLGDSAPPTARPAQPKRQADPFVEVRDVLNELRRQFEPRTAKPRQGAPVARPPALPPQAQPAQRQAHPLQPQFRPQQQQQPPRPAVPPRQAPRPQPPRMVQQQSQGAAPRQVPVQQQRPAPMARRQPQRPQVRVAEEDEGPHMPFPTSSQKKPRVKAPRQHSRWLSNHNDLRRGIILSEILGPPKAFQ